MSCNQKFNLPPNWRIEAIVWAAKNKGMSYAAFSEAEGLNGAGKAKLDTIYADYQKHFHKMREDEARRCSEHKNNLAKRALPVAG